MAGSSVGRPVFEMGADDDQDSTHVCAHLTESDSTPNDAARTNGDAPPPPAESAVKNLEAKCAAVSCDSRGGVSVPPSATEPTTLRNQSASAETLETDTAEQATNVKPEPPRGAEAVSASSPRSERAPSPHLSPLRLGGRRFTVTRLEELPGRVPPVPTSASTTSTESGPNVACAGAGSGPTQPPSAGVDAAAADTAPDWDWDTPTPPQQQTPRPHPAAMRSSRSFSGRNGVPAQPYLPVIARAGLPAGWATPPPPLHATGPRPPSGPPPHLLNNPALAHLAGQQAPYATIQGNLSAPLLQQLMSPQYQPSHTISYGHSDGRHLTVRRLLDWEVPDLHTVRKYESQSDVDSMSTRSVVPTHRSKAHHPRRTWTNKVEFILACLGYAVGLSNLWRFPYLCFKYGGGAFLIPYLVMMFLCSVSLLLMELTVGQFTRLGPVGAMGRLCPLLKGAGLAPVVMSFLFCTYYNVVIAWALIYLFSSFAADVPWKNCNNTWNQPTCEEVSAMNKSQNATTPSEEFFNYRVLQLSSGVEHLGSLRLPLILTLVLAWVLVYFSIWKSIRSSGKVVYFTVIAPYLLLVAFLWRALTLKGASSGIRFLFEPRWDLLKDAHVWVTAAAQNFNAVGIGYGPMITFASYNKFNNRSLLLDTIIICSVNLLTCVMGGVIVFASLGNLAQELNRPIENVVVDGPGLVYMAYPRVLAIMPVTQLWAVLFFLMLICLGLDSQFATLEVVITSLQDAYGSLVRRYLRRHELLVLCICLVSLGLGLPYVTQGGMYLFHLMDSEVANNSLMLLALFEVIAVAWIYGTDRLSQDYYTMTGKRPSIFFKFCWKFLSPVLIFAIWVFGVIFHKRVTYGSYVYPAWTTSVGWVLAMLPVLPIPVCAFLALWRAPGNSLAERVKASVTPDRRVRSEVGYEPTVGDDILVDGLDYELQPVTGGLTIHPHQGLTIHPHHHTTFSPYVEFNDTGSSNRR